MKCWNTVGMVAVAAMGCLMWASVVSAAVIIDDFSAGAVTVTALDLTGNTVTQTGLPTTSPIGGTRQIYVGALASSTGSPSEASGAVETIKQRFNFRAPDDRFGYFQLTYGSTAPLNMDLTANGGDRFVIDLLDVSDFFVRGIYEINVVTEGLPGGLPRTDSVSFAQQLFALSGGPDSFGRIVIPFDQFMDIDFTRVREISIIGARVETGGAISFDSISIIPEPASALLLLSAAGLLAGKRNRRSPAGCANRSVAV